MDDDEHRERRFYAVSYQDDIPRTKKGTLIPYERQRLQRRSSYAQAIVPYVTPAIVFVTISLFIFTLVSIGMDTYSRYQTASLPTVTVVSPLTEEARSLNYGVSVSFEQPGFFSDTRDAFIDAAATFVEIDLAAMQLRYFEDGVLVKSFEILAKGQPGSWWETPAGLYQIESKKEKHYSMAGQVYQPWSMAFQGNFFIHGVPIHPDGTEVEGDFTGGCVRLSTANAEALYKLVKLKTPILVHESAPEEQTVLYKLKVPELKTPHYLVADVESGTVLAASDLDQAAPIASLAKLMTALVAVENLNLDTSVFVAQPTFVQSLIPRLGDRSKVSLYSLLQLLLIESSNEAAEVIAAQLGRERFVSLMNEKAAVLGMTGSYFADPSGLSAENIASLGDLLRLTQYIYKNRRFIFEITANQKLPTVHVSDEFGELVNFNEVKNLNNFIGGKIGETLAAGQTSISLHTLSVDGVTRILSIVILGSESRSDDVTQLYDYALQRFAR